MLTKNLKFIEIRDRATCIPALAVLLDGSFSDAENKILSHAGYGNPFSMHYVYLIHLTNGVGHYDPHQWNDGTRTMLEAHRYILKNYDKITSGQVVDVRFILGEAEAPAKSDIQDKSFNFEKLTSHQDIF